MTLLYKDTHVEEALGNLLQQFKGLRRLESLITAFAHRVQNLEDTYFDLFLKRSIDEAEGAQLDGLGRILNLERAPGLDDDTYRLRLRAKIQLNRSGGTIEDIISLIRLLVGNKQVKVSESFPAHFDAVVEDPIDVDGFEVSSLVQSAKPVGVRGIFQWHTTGTPFVFEGEPNGLGFNEGHFAGAADF